jgi:WD40 repeat protein
VEKTFTFGKTVNDQQLSCLWHKQYICTLSLSGAINYLDTNADEPTRVVHGHMVSITAVAVDQASQVFYSADRSGIVCAWKDYNAVWFGGDGHGKAVIDISLNSDASKLVSVGLDDKVRVNDCKSQSFSSSAVARGGSPVTVVCGRAHADLVAVGLAQDKVVVFAGGASKVLALPSKPTSLDFNHDDSMLAVGTHKGPVLVYRVSGNALTEAYELKDHDKSISKVQWSPDGKFLAVSAARRILVFSGAKIVNPSEWEYHEALVTDVAFGARGRVASVSNDLGVIIWKDTTAWGTDRKTIKMAHREGIQKCAWLRDDLLLTVGNDSCMKVWNC